MIVSFLDEETEVKSLPNSHGADGRQNLGFIQISVTPLSLCIHLLSFF